MIGSWSYDIVQTRLNNPKIIFFVPEMAKTVKTEFFEVKKVKRIMNLNLSIH